MKSEQTSHDNQCCCTHEGESLSGAYGCEDKKYVFTPREQEVLGKIREAASRARSIKEELRNMGPDDARREQVLHDLEQLRKTRAELEEERIAAAEERMRMLGHI